MTTDQTIALIKAVTDLLSVLVWPAVLVFVLIRFRKGIADFVASLTEFSVKGLGVEASGRRRQEEAAANVAAAEAAKAAVAEESEGPGTPVALGPAPDVVKLAKALPGAREQRRLADARVLWVDDRPENNTYERRALIALGIRVDTCTSTQEALTLHRALRYDLIVSDMGRPPDQRAGYTLLDELRSAGDRTPYVIYASSRSAEHVAEARRHGALGCTNRPQELVEYVVQGLGAT